MRESFERIVLGYNEVAKKSFEADLADGEAEELDAVLDARIKAAVLERDSTPEAQREIARLQERKQRIMQKLRERIALLDDPDHVPEHGIKDRRVTQVDGRYVAHGMAGFPDEVVTLGDIITDIDWGTYYYLDPQTVDRNIRKRYLIEDAKHEIAALLDQQITRDEMASGDTDYWNYKAYEKRAGDSELKEGFIAERMVKSFLKKLAIDHGADFEVVESDAVQDVEEKMDFIIRVKRRYHHNRGVEVQEREDVTGVGVQFTIRTDQEATDGKTVQVDRSRRALRKGEGIDDIVLVQVPSLLASDLYGEWKRNPRPGGPDRLWNLATKRLVFAKVMEGILTPEEITDQWARITGEDGESGAGLALAA